jgi:hypothetical protein
LTGYDQDPREVWEIPEAARYVRWWAAYAGMDDFEVADSLIGSKSPNSKDPLLCGAGVSFLAACGAFGEEIKRQSLAGFAPTMEH